MPPSDVISSDHSIPALVPGSNRTLCHWEATLNDTGGGAGGGGGGTELAYEGREFIVVTSQ